MYSINYGSQLINNSFLTEFHPDVLVGVRVPKGVVLITVAHQRKDDVREESVEVRLDQLPRVGMVHSEEEERREGVRGNGEGRGRERREEKRREGGGDKEGERERRGRERGREKEKGGGEKRREIKL